MAEQAAAYLGPAVENSRLFAESQREAREREVLAEIGRIVAGEPDIQSVYARLAAKMGELIPWDRLMVNGIDWGRDVFIERFQAGLDIPSRRAGDEIPLDGSLTGDVGRTRQPVLLNLKSGPGPLEARWPGAMPDYNVGLRSYITVPLVHHDQVIGTIHFRSVQPGLYGEEHLRLAVAVAGQIAGAIAAADLNETVRREAEERAALAEISRIISSAANVEDVYPQFTARVASLIPFDWVGLGLINEAGDAVTIRYQSGAYSEGRVRDSEISLEGSLAGEASRDLRPVIVNSLEPAVLERWPLAAPLAEFGFNSILVAPLVHDGAAIGMLSVASRRPGAYSQRHGQTAEAVCAQVAGVIAAARLNETVRREAEVRRALASISVAMIEDPRLDGAFEGVADELGKLIRFDRMAVSLRDGDSNAAKTVFVRGVELEGYLVGAPLPAPLQVSWEWEAVVAGRAPDSGPVRSSGLESALIVPFGSQGQTPLGFLSLRSREKDAYTEEDLDLLGRVAVQMTPVLQNMIEHQRTVRTAEERQVIAELGRLVSGPLTFEQVFPSFAEQLKRLVSYDRLVVTLLDEKTNEWVDVCVAGVVGPGAEQGLRWAYATRFRDGEDARQLVTRTGTESIELGRTRRNIRAKVEAGLRGQMMVPMFWQDRVIGSINLWSREEAPYQEREAALGRQVAAQVSGAVVASRAHAELQHEAEVRRSLAALGVAAGQDLNLEGIFGRISGEVSKLLNYDRLSVALTENSGLRLVYVTGVDLENHRVGAWYPERVARRPAPHDTALGGAARGSHFRKDMEAARLHSWVIAPIAPGAKGPIGWLSLRSKARDAYTSRDMDLLNRMGVQIAPAVQNALAHSQEMKLAAERERAARLEAQAREMERVAEAKSLFLTTISHELRTPLTSISAFADILVRNRDANLNDRQLKQMDVIRRNSRLLAMLINDLLDLSRIDSGNFSIVRAGFDISQMLSDVCENFRPMYADSDQVLTCSLPQPGTKVVADRDRLGQVVANLLSNAGKYSPKGAEVVLKAEVTDGRLSVAVTDYGVGISKDDMSRLFTMFFRVDNEATRSVPGSGIGLYIARQIVEMHGGQIEAVSEPGRGATFSFWVPREAPPAGPAQLQPEGGPLPGGPSAAR